MGRFITADTIVQKLSNPQTLNRYTYANNNPVNNIDPDGHGFFKSFFRAIVGAVVRAVVAAILPVLAPVVFASDIFVGAISGAIAGVATSAAFGGDIGLGAGIGFVAGGAFGTSGSNGVLGGAGPPVGLTLLAGGLAHSASQNGLKGVGNFAAGVAGGVVGTVAGNAVGSAIAGTLQDPATVTDAAQGQGNQQSQQQTKPNSENIQKVNSQKGNPIAVAKGVEQIAQKAADTRTTVLDTIVVKATRLPNNSRNFGLMAQGLGEVVVGGALQVASAGLFAPSGGVSVAGISAGFGIMAAGLIDIRQGFISGPSFGDILHESVYGLKNEAGVFYPYIKAQTGDVLTPF